MRILVEDTQKYVKSITDPQAKEYARWIAQRIIDPMTQEWEWMVSEFAPQLESYPTLTSQGVSTNG